MPVHDEAVPGSAENTTELRDSKSIGVAAHWRNTQAQRAQMKENISTTQPEHHVTEEKIGHQSFISACVCVCVFTKDWISLCQVLQHGVEGADEEIVPELHHRQPDQMEEEEPGQETLTKTSDCRRREETDDPVLGNSVGVHSGVVI